MESESLKIFNEEQKPIGVATRDEVHRKGYWHETFHCWFYSRVEERINLYFQLRSETKKDYPNLLDITAAGHLLASETVKDGVREVTEELGINISIGQLEPVGIIKYSVKHGELIDNELAHTYLFEWTEDWSAFSLQREEVAGIVKVDLRDFSHLLKGDIREIKAIGFTTNGEGEFLPYLRMVSKNKFVPHELDYYEKIIKAILMRKS